MATNRQCAEALAKELLHALIDLKREIHVHHKMRVKTDFALMTADAQACTAIFKAQSLLDAGGCGGGEQDSTAAAIQPEPLSEEELASFMRQRIENGDLDADDIPVRLARYGLMTPDRFGFERFGWIH